MSRLSGRRIGGYASICALEELFEVKGFGQIGIIGIVLKTHGRSVR